MQGLPICQIPSKMLQAKNVKHMTEEMYADITEKPQKKRPFWRPRKRKEDTIKIELEKRRWEGVEWIHLAYDREDLRALVNTVVDVRDSRRMGKLTSLGTVTVSLQSGGYLKKKTLMRSDGL